jgi:hypothetical protein
MTTTSYWPFFLTALFPCLVALIGILVNKHDFAILRQDIGDLRGQIQHLIDLHFNHEGRIATVEERTKPK